MRRRSTVGIGVAAAAATVAVVIAGVVVWPALNPHCNSNCVYDEPADGWLRALEWAVMGANVAFIALPAAIAVGAVSALAHHRHVRRRRAGASGLGPPPAPSRWFPFDD